MSTFVRNTLLAALLAVAIPAQASILTWNFSGTVDSGSLLSQTYSGLFSFDDAALTSVGSEYLAVSSLSMMFNNVAFTLTNELAPTEAVFEAGSFTGMNFSAANFSFIPGSADTSDAYFAYDTLLPALSGTGNVIYAPVPEPETWTMVLMGLGLVGFMTRRHKA
jgi:hypothetical protein